MLLRAVELNRHIGSRGQLALGLEALAAAVRDDDPERAVVLLGAAAYHLQERGMTRSPERQRLRDDTQAVLAGRLGDDAFNGAWATGVAMGVEDAAAAVLSRSGIGRDVAP